MLYGCVPIIVQEQWRLPFDGLLNYSAFSISVSMGQLGNLKEIARAADWQVLSYGLKRARSAFLYQLDGYASGRGMLPLLLFEMWRLTATASRWRARPPVSSHHRHHSSGLSLGVTPLFNSVAATADANFTTRWHAAFGTSGEPYQDKASARMAGATMLINGSYWRCDTFRDDGRVCRCLQLRSEAEAAAVASRMAARYTAATAEVRVSSITPVAATATAAGSARAIGHGRAGLRSRQVTGGANVSNVVHSVQRATLASAALRAASARHLLHVSASPQ